MKKLIPLILIATGLFLPKEVGAGVFEVSLGAWFNRSNYAVGSFTWTRRLGASLAYHFNQHSGIELATQDVKTRTKLDQDGVSLQNSTYKDRVYSVSWIQHFLGKKYPFQPYFKAGVAQLNRDIEGTFFGAPSKIKSEDSLNIAISLGFKLFFTRQIAFRSEATTYLTEGGLSTWEDNLAGSVGLSVFF